MRKILTPNFSEASLCNSCKFAIITEGKQFKQKMTRCTEHRKLVEFDVTDCNCYQHKNSPSLWDMQQIAWSLMTDKKGEKIGFRCPKDAEKLAEAGKADIAGNRLPEEF